MYKKLKKNIISKKAKIAVVGLGYVGLPLAVSFAKAGFEVCGIDTDKDRISRLKKAIPYILDVKKDDLQRLIKSKKLKGTADFKVLKDIDIIFICVPTPLKRKYHPNISFILSAVKKIRKYIKGKLVVLESTTYPGTTDEVILPLFEKGGLKCGEDFFLAFSPERIDPGNKVYSVEKITKIVGGVTKESTILAKLLYQKAIKKVHSVSSAKIAETVKLLENTFRIVNIGLINEVAMMCHKLDIDIWEVIRGAKTKPFGFMPFYPGPGVGGHCIPKDPLYLYWKARKFGFRSRFIKLAADINSSMPYYIFERLKEILKDNKKSLKAAKILILGVTYKKDVKDLRKSPALDMIARLQDFGVDVSYSDPLIPYLRFNDIHLKSVLMNKKNLSWFDCVVIVSDHEKINYSNILKNANLIFDTRNVYSGKNDKRIKRL